MEAKKKPVTIVDVARACGVSKSTVAYILNGTGNHRTPEEKVRLVKGTARALGYRVNTAARALSRGKTSTIAIMMPIGGSEFYDRIAIAQQELLAERGFASMFVLWANRDTLEIAGERIRRAVQTCSFDGVITWEPNPVFQEKDLPSVLYSYTPGMYDSVMTDIRTGIHILLDYLKSMGHKNIGFIGQKEGIGGREFLVSLKERNMHPVESWLIDATYYETYSAILKMDPKGPLPDALITQSDVTAIPAIQALRQLGLSVPEDISIVSFDNITDAAYCSPPLTTLDLQVDKIALALVDTLCQKISGDRASEEAPKQILIPPHLVIRESCISKIRSPDTKKTKKRKQT